MKEYSYLNSYRDRHGKMRHYYRRDGKSTPIFHSPGTALFEAVYNALHNLHAKAIKTDAECRTWRWLCAHYFQSSDFAQLHPDTQRTRHLILEATCQESWTPGSSRVFGNAPLEAMTPRAVAVLRDRKKGLPNAAISRLSAVSRVFEWALMPESGILGITSNPVKTVRRPKERPDAGFHTWTLAEIKQYEHRHPIGSQARLALALLLFTGQRRSDVVLLGPRCISDGILTFTQHKNRHRRPVRLKLPELPELHAIIEASPCGTETFLVTSYGKPFSAKGFGNKMRNWCNQAGLPHCSAHGLRKAGAVIAAQNGATPHQLMSIFGWRTLRQAERYTKAVDQGALAAAAMPLLLQAPNRPRQ